jgi:hypothetical protein
MTWFSRCIQSHSLIIDQTIQVDKVIKSLKIISAVHVSLDGHNLLLCENCVNVDSMKSVSNPSKFIDEILVFLENKPTS